MDRKMLFYTFLILIFCSCGRTSKSTTPSGEGKEITLENLSPVFTPEQEAAKRRELEQQLYEVFRKYADKRESEEAGT